MVSVLFAVSNYVRNFVTTFINLHVMVMVELLDFWVEGEKVVPVLLLREVLGGKF